jgi:hypothetical protein
MRTRDKKTRKHRKHRRHMRGGGCTVGQTLNPRHDCYGQTSDEVDA